MKVNLQSGVRHRILEYSMYISMWIIVVLAPLFSGLTKSTPALEWESVVRNFKFVATFLTIFIVYDISFTLLLSKKVKGWVHLITIALCIAFVVVPNSLLNRSKLKMLDERPPRELPPPAFDRGPHHHPPGFEFKPPLDKRGEDRAFDPLFLPPPFGNILLAIIIMGFNTVIKLQFRSVKKLQRLKELEKEHVETELAYLRSQISPHFFMNTLNNIHALIDVDSEKAKDTVIELSKLMRFLLYESGQPTILLEKEVSFLSHFVELMRLRFTEGVDIVMDVPEVISPSIQVPPLLLLPFFENAFKHGISYQQKSFVHFKLEIMPGKLLLSVKNSNHRYKGTDKSTGIGLENVRKRLQLLFEKKHILIVNETKDVFEVELTLFISDS